MGEIFFIIGAWLIVSGIRDLRVAASLEVIDEPEAEPSYEAETAIRTATVA